MMNKNAHAQLGATREKAEFFMTDVYKEPLFF